MPFGLHVYRYPGVDALVVSGRVHEIATREIRWRPLVKIPFGQSHLSHRVCGSTPPVVSGRVHEIVTREIRGGGSDQILPGPISCTRRDTARANGMHPESPDSMGRPHLDLARYPVGHSMCPRADHIQVLNARIAQMQAAGSAPEQLGSAIEDLNDYYERGIQLRTMRIGTLEEEKREIEERAMVQSRRMWRIVIGVFVALCVLIVMMVEFTWPGTLEILAAEYWSHALTAIIAVSVSRTRT